MTETKSWESDPAIRLQRLEERSCECGAAGSGEGHASFCRAKVFNHIPKNKTAKKALRLPKIAALLAAFQKGQE